MKQLALRYTLQLPKTKKKLDYKQIHNTLDEIMSLYFERHSIEAFASTMMVCDVDVTEGTQSKKKSVKQSKSKDAKTCAKV